ncbi:MAG: FtsX-like permease family protein [Tannerellaceae bacterium]|nr:FtsX-like permease family protein [Tannerellaceae bacterium]
MNVSAYIARRYLFSKKSHNAINMISLVSVCGVVVVTAALVCALSVMNGFNELIFRMFGSLDPHLKVTPLRGKVFDPSTLILRIDSLSGVECTGATLEDRAFVRYNGRLIVAMLKGVDDNYARLTDIGGIIIDGEFKLSDEVVSYAVPGIGVAVAIGVHANFTAPIEIMAPKRDEQINLSNPAASMQVEYAYASAVFQSNQQTYDENLLIVPINLARSLFRYEAEISSIEIKLAADANPGSVKKQVEAIVGDQFRVKDRYEQQDIAFKMMQTEKWMTFLILCFILVIALFNMVGSLSMLMIEKQDDVRTLRTLGADNNLIRRIFLLEGWMISGFGAGIGLLIGIGLCLLQQQFGLIKMGSAGVFVVDNYPVLVSASDLGVILATVILTGFLSAWYPVYCLGKRWLGA